MRRRTARTGYCAAAVLLALIGSTTTGCAGLARLGLRILAPIIREAPGRNATVTYAPPTSASPLGSIVVRLWAEVENPNPIGLTLDRLEGTLFLDAVRAAEAVFPLGLPLRAGESDVVPLDVVVRLSDLPDLRRVVERAIANRTLPYRLDGLVTVDARELGHPSFGPSTLLRGQLSVER